MITSDTPMMSEEEMFQYGSMSAAEHIAAGRRPWGYFPDGRGGAFQDPDWMESEVFRMSREQRRQQEKQR
mgnify:CR=1 FL=1